METERARFVIEAELSDLSHAEFCRRYNISRPTGYKWIRRCQEEGVQGLEDRSHRPLSCPHATSQPVVDQILAIRKKRSWGAKKIRTKLEKDPSIDAVPSIDTIGRILQRNGCIEPQKTGPSPSATSGRER